MGEMLGKGVGIRGSLLSMQRNLSTHLGLSSCAEQGERRDVAQEAGDCTKSLNDLGDVFATRKSSGNPLKQASDS